MNTYLWPCAYAAIVLVPPARSTAPPAPLTAVVTLFSLTFSKIRVPPVGGLFAVVLNEVLTASGVFEMLESTIKNAWSLWSAGEALMSTPTLQLLMVRPCIVHLGISLAELKHACQKDCSPPIEEQRETSHSIAEGNVAHGVLLVTDVHAVKSAGEYEILML